MSARARLLRIARRLALGVLATVVVLVVVITFGLPTEPGRRFALDVTTRALANRFRGQIVVDAIDELRPWRGVATFRGRVLDPEGHEVIRVGRASAQIDLPRLVFSLMGSGPVDVALSVVEIDDARVSLATGPDGALALARAFESKTPNASTGRAAPGVVFDSGDVHATRVTLENEGIPGGGALIKDAKATVHFEGGHLRALASSFIATVHDPLTAEAKARPQLLAGLGPVTVEGQGGAALMVHDLRSLELDVAAKASAGGSPPQASADVAFHYKESVLGSVRARIAPAIARSLDLPVTPTVPVDVSLTAAGPATAIDGQGTIDAGASHMDVTVRADVTRGLVDGTVSARDIDLHLADERLPSSRLAATARAHVDLTKRSATTDARVDAGTVADVATPALTAKLALDASQKPTLDFDVLTEETSLEPLGALSPSLKGARGRGVVHARGRVDLQDRTVDGHVSAGVTGASTAGVNAARVTAEIDVRGPLAKPVADVDVRASGVRVPGARAATITMKTTARPREGGMDLAGTRVRWSAGNVSADARADTVAIGPGVHAPRVVIEGLGEPVTGRVDLTPGGWTFVARAPAVDAERLGALVPLPEQASGRFDADVDLRLDGSGVHGKAIVGTSELSAGAEKGRGRVTLVGRGRTVEVEGNLRVARLGGVRLPKTEIRIDGDPRRPETWRRAAGEVTAESDVAIRDLVGRFVDESTIQIVGRAHTKVRVTREKPGAPLVTSFDVTTRGLELYTDAGYVRGTEVAASGVLDDKSLAVSAEAFDARGTVLGARLLVASGRKGGLDLARSPLHATLTLPARTLDSFTFDDIVRGSDVHAAAVFEATGSLDAPHLVGWTRCAVPGSLEVRADEVDLAWDRGGVALPRGVLRTRGRVAIPEIVARLGDRVPEDFRATGELTFDALARRDPGDALPSGRAIMTTRRLGLRRGGLALTGADARLSFAFRAPTGEASLSAMAWDAAGALLSVDAKAEIPDAPLTAPDVTWIFGDGWREVPFSVRATLPPRRVASFGPLLTPADAWREADASTRSAWSTIEGGVALEASAVGTMKKPSVLLRGEALGIRQTERVRRGARPSAPVDGTLYATYDGSRADVGMTIIDAGKPTLQGAFTSVMSLASLLAGEVDVRASGDVRARSLRVGVLPVIGTSVKGTFDGDLLLRDYGKDARVEAKLTGKDVSLDSVRVKTAEVRAFAHDTELSAAVGLEQTDGGWAGAEVQTGMRWGAALAPTRDPSHPLRLAYRVDAFQLAALRPLVRNSLPELDGRVDGRGTLVREGGVDTASGSLALRKGTAYVPLLGQNVEDVTFDVRLGSGTFTVENGSARIDRGEALFAASGRVEGLSLTGVRGEVRAGTRRELPIYYEGIRYGAVTGSASFEGRLDEKEIRLDVTVPKARLELASLEARTVQKLDDAKHVRIGFGTPNGFVIAPRARTRGTGAASTGLARPLVVHATLGTDVILSQGATLYLPMQGEIEALPGESPRLDGTIELTPGGTLNLKGRRFQIESGTLTWAPEDEPSNPTVVATATWEAPEKSVVIASFRGPAKTGKLELRSEPAHTSGEILSLLLVGTTDGKVEGAGGAVSAQVGAPIAGGLGQAVSELTSVEVNATVESPDARTTRPEVSVRVRPEVTVQLGYNIAPQTVEQDRLLLTVDWRFAQRWSVQATGGDRGAAIFDLLWQYRY